MAHSHCGSCYRTSCRAVDDCPVQPCPANCGASLHRCKLEEHSLLVCPATLVTCTNASLGCEAELPRAKLGRHLPHCPASLVQCRFAYDRTSVDTQSTQQIIHESPDELCIDEKALQADLVLAEQHQNLYGTLPNEGEPLQFSLECHPGSLVTDACSKSTAMQHTPLPPRSRACISASVLQYTIGGPSTVHYFCFPCNELVRRDEFSSHWRDTHVGIHSSLSSIVERCPLRAYGCRHKEIRLTPTPIGASLQYLSEADCFSVRLPDHATEDGETHSLPGVYAQHIRKQQELASYGYGGEIESYDVLSQLPAEILMNICASLDSLGLWNLSLVNRYLRSVCFNLVKRKGIVYRCWKKNKATGRWEQGEKVCVCVCVFDC